MTCSSLRMTSLALCLAGLLYDVRSRRHCLLAGFNSLWTAVDRRKMTMPVENERRQRAITVTP
jgi:hypothetical protein